MNKLAAITLTSMMLLLATATIVSAVDKFEVRGAVFPTATTPAGDWSAQNFAGFYYDIKDNLGTETLTFIPDPTNERSLLADTGVVYRTSTQPKEFDFDKWGHYNVIGFLAEKYFAGYISNVSSNNDILCDMSGDENVLGDDQLNKILVDDDTEKTVTSGTPLEMQEGYVLSVKAIDIDGNKVYVELSKDGTVVDSAVVSPSKSSTASEEMKDKTYYYKKTVGDSKDLVLMGVHFKNAFRGTDQNLATVDGMWQISEEFVDVSADKEYDKMTTVASPVANEIMMVNKDEAITLSKNKDISLMTGVSIKVADNTTTRYYIYKPVTIEGAVAPAAETAPAVEVAPAVENKTAEAPAVEPAKVEENKTVTEPVKAEENKTKTEPAPGFEGILAITGLLAVAYLVLGRKE